MAIDIAATPNPNALKFTVGVDVGGPTTHAAGQDVEEEPAKSLLAIDGVTSIFMTADFVTISKSPDASWNAIAPRVQEILEATF